MFKWNRHTDAKTHSSRGDVQDWIKRVERASTDAAREVFGNNYQSILEQVHVDDDALVEAQDLLDSWLHEKKNDDLSLEVQFKNETWAQRSKRSKELTRASSAEDYYSDQLLQSHDWASPSSYNHSPSLDIIGPEYDDDLHDEISVQQILRDMLDKKVVEEDILNDLGFDGSKKKKDPRPKMELRHKQVKEKSVARQKDLEKKRREHSARKQAEAEARQQLIREEKEKQTRFKKEEEEISKEMAKIRRVMEEEKKAAKEKLDSERRKEQEAELLARQYLEEEQKQKEERLRKEFKEKEEMRQMLLEEMERKAAEEASNNLRTVQRHFSAWYSVVASQRIKVGKARAMSDWRCKLRAWNAWRAYVNHIRSDKEAHAVTMEMKEKHRKEQLSAKFHRRHLLARCLRAWQKWVKTEQEEQQLREEHNRKTQKMAALLEAAASGRLWSERGGKMDVSLELKDIEEDGTEQSSSTARKLDELFSQPGRILPNRDKHPLRGEKPSEETLSKNFASSNKPPVSKSAWTKQSATESAKKTHRSEKETKLKSQRQRTYSEVENVEIFSTVQNGDNHKRVRNKNNNNFSVYRSKSVEKLGYQDVQTEEESLSERSGITTTFADDDNSTERSKFTSREAVVKSQKPATKPLHLAMEERAQQRMLRKKALDEKKRKAEEEKLAFLKKEQERKEAELLAEKQEALRKRKEEKRITREREIEKQRQQEHNRHRVTMATQHYTTTLLVKFGLLPWRRLVEIARENMARATLYHNMVLLRMCFSPWLKYTRQVGEEREKAADSLYKKILLRRTWKQWRKYGQHAVRLQAVAEDYCSSYLVKKYFRYWQDYVTEQQIMLWEKERMAEEHDEWRIKKLALTYWKKYIPMKRGEKERETRREEMRKRVSSWLPDFQNLPETSP